MLLGPAPLALIATYLLLRYYTYETPFFLRLTGHHSAATHLESLIWAKWESLLPRPTPRDSAVASADDHEVGEIEMYNAVDAPDYQLSSPAQSSALELPLPVAGSSTATSNAEKRPSASLRATLQEPLEQRPTGAHLEDTSQPVSLSSETRQPRATKKNFSPTISLTAALLSYPPLRNRLLIGWALSILQQISGINVFVSASNTLFLEAGLPPKYTTAASAVMALLAFLCAAVTALHIQYIPRRSMLVGGALFMSLSLLPSSLSSYLTPPGSKVEQLLSVFSTLAFVSVYSCTYGPGLFVYLNELWPADIKVKKDAFFPCISVTHHADLR